MSISSRYFLREAELRAYDMEHPDEHIPRGGISKPSEGELARRDMEAYRRKFTDEQWQQMEEQYQNRDYKHGL